MRYKLLLLLTVLGCFNAASVSFASVRLDEIDPYLRIESSLQVGNKGEVAIDVSLPADAPRCGEMWVFDRVELKILDNRFGDAQFIALPEPGCIDCKKARIRWYHEPTGHLRASVHVYRRSMISSCIDERGGVPPDQEQARARYGQ